MFNINLKMLILAIVSFPLLIFITFVVLMFIPSPCYPDVVSGLSITSCRPFWLCNYESGNYLFQGAINITCRPYRPTWKCRSKIIFQCTCNWQLGHIYIVWLS